VVTGPHEFTKLGSFGDDSMKVVRLSALGPRGSDNQEPVVFEFEMDYEGAMNLRNVLSAMVTALRDEIGH